ncbi:spore germination protein [Falsibacillus pallidus]|uniref:Spore germination protein KA n=1 Tax=Falsibacillus pallidus TaxID=493781 RepID=A0A370GTW3_9BACI|nr:spore germination protein [Falsibacillus pallidus]RDI45984.1 spore germination protein KA [Falsibacillus pallidus]
MKRDKGKLSGTTLQEKYTRIQEALGFSADLLVMHKEFNKGGHCFHIVLLRIDGISDGNGVVELFRSPELQSMDSMDEVIGKIGDHGMNIEHKEYEKDFHKLTISMLEGDTIILFEGREMVLKVSTLKTEGRQVTEPTSQTVIRGPKDAFVESIRINTALVRKRIKNEQLRLERFQSGEKSKANIELMYLADQVDYECLEKIRTRISEGSASLILESGYIEKMIQDNQKTIFPTIMNTERPDEVASNILMGKIAVFVDNTPFVLICPVTFYQFFQSPEDYYHNFNISFLLQTLRFVGFFLSLLAPAIYVGLITHHHAMIPTPLLISLYAQREGIPFPVIIETFLMEFIYEILREAGVRMPRAIGQAVSIVGALVIGQSAVEAGLVSTAVVIVVSITAISSFTMPNYNLAISARILRFIFMGVSYFIGFYGLLLGLMMLCGHLLTITSMGRPYLRGLDNQLSKKDKMMEIRDAK